MKALVLKDYHNLSFEEVPKPEFGPDDLLVNVKACAICGSDVQGIDGSTGRRQPQLLWATKLQVWSRLWAVM